MKEEQRIILARKIRKEKQQLKKLRGKAKRLEELKKDPAVIEYLKLSQEIQNNYGSMNLKYVSEHTILKKRASEEKMLDCEDKYLIRVGVGKKHQDGRFFQLDSFEGDTYYYTCLDCHKNFYINKNDILSFEQDKMIIEAEGTNIYDFNRFRMRYFELLMDYESPQAFLILKNEIEGRRRVRN